MEDFGDYELDELLARGGMSEIFRARHKATNTVVVVKMLLPELEGRADIVDGFLTEADIGQLLRHPNIVAVLDAGEHDGRYFIVMEYVDGLDLHEMLRFEHKRKARMPVNVSMRIAVDVLRGLHAAHELTSPQGKPFGLVHRDVSPDNLYVTVDGVTKVADFGIVKLGTFGTGTLSGVLKGKLAYMSPDSLNGHKLDGRADQFSLGLVVYEMLSGMRPFAPDYDEGELHALARVRKSQVPPLARHVVDVPKPVIAVIEKALRKTRWLRHQTCAEMADALEGAAGKAGVLASRTELAAYVQRIRRPV